MTNESAIVLPVIDQDARGAPGRARSKAIAKTQVVVTGQALEKAASVTRELRLCPLGTIVHAVDPRAVVELAGRELCDVAIFVSDTTNEAALAFPKAVRATAESRRVIAVLGHPLGEEIAARALEAGYDAVLNLDTPSRLYYRTIASLVQEVRRDA